MGPEERITYYSNNFGYSHLNPSSNNGVTHRVASLEMKEVNPPQKQNSNIQQNVQDLRAPSAVSNSIPNDTPVRLKQPLPTKVMRINGVEV